MSYVIDLSKSGVGVGHTYEFDWQNVKMIDFLEHFHDLIVHVSTTLNISSHIFFHEIGEVHLLIQSWLNSTDRLQSAMGKRMKDTFNKYWGLWHSNNTSNENYNAKGKRRGKEKKNINLMNFVVVCLDSRYKLSLYTKIAVEEIFGEHKLLIFVFMSCLKNIGQYMLQVKRRCHLSNSIKGR
jgi:hypothetical protein